MEGMFKQKMVCVYVWGFCVGLSLAVCILLGELTHALLTTQTRVYRTQPGVRLIDTDRQFNCSESITVSALGPHADLS